LKKKNNLPKGWTEAKARRVLKHYDSQSETDAVAEDEAAYRNRKHAVMMVPPLKLVPTVRSLISRRAS
jgi:hypothetical protein